MSRSWKDLEGHAVSFGKLLVFRKEGPCRQNPGKKWGGGGRQSSSLPPACYSDVWYSKGDKFCLLQATSSLYQMYLLPAFPPKTICSIQLFMVPHSIYKYRVLRKTAANAHYRTPGRCRRPPISTTCVPAPPPPPPNCTPI